jgi:hypothetical protein
VDAGVGRLLGEPRRLVGSDVHHIDEVTVGTVEGHGGHARLGLSGEGNGDRLVRRDITREPVDLLGVELAVHLFVRLDPIGRLSSVVRLGLGRGHDSGRRSVQDPRPVSPVRVERLQAGRDRRVPEHPDPHRATRRQKARDLQVRSSLDCRTVT